MAAYDWAPSLGNGNYSHQNFLASQNRGGGGGQGAGMRIPLNNKPLPQMPGLSIPGVAPMPNLPQFSTQLPGLANPNLPGMASPQLTTNVSLPQYQRPGYNDMSAGYAGLSNQLMAMLGGGGQGGPGGQVGNVSSAINASPLFTSSFAQQANQSQQPRQVGGGGGGMPPMNGAQKGAIGQLYNDNASRLSQQNTTGLDRQRAQAQAGFGLDAQQARAGSGLGLMGLLTGLYGDQVQGQNNQEDALLRLLSQIGVF